MITKHSIDLRYEVDPCFAVSRDGTCKVLIKTHERCGSYKCPFYKPKNCKSWIRIGNDLIPPEEAFRRL